MDFFALDAAILRQRFLVGLQTREKFDSTEHALGGIGADFFGRRHHAVEPEGNLGRAVAHLQMDVAGVRALGLRDEFFENFRRGNVGGRIHSLFG